MAEHSPTPSPPEGPEERGAEGRRAEGFGAGVRAVTAANAAILIGLATALVIVINLVAANAYTRWDWTDKGALALSERTRRFLAAEVDGQQHPVRLYVFYPPYRAYALARRRDEVFAVHHLAREFDLAADNLVLETLDPEANRGRVDQLREEFQITQDEFQRGVVAFEYRGRQKYVTDLQLFETDIEAQRAAGGNVQVPRKFLGEDRFLGAIVNLVQGDPPTAAILVGHGELNPDAPSRSARRVQQALQRDTFQVDVLDLKGHHTIRKDYDLICILQPTQPLPPTAVTALEGHLARGGGLLVCAGPNLDPRPDGQVVVHQTGLRRLLKQWGIHLPDPADLVLMSAENRLGRERQFADSFAPQLDGEHPVTRTLTTDRGRYVFWQAPIRSVRYDDEGRNKTQGWTLAKTDERGVRVTDFVAYFRYLKDPAALRRFLSDGTRHPRGEIPVGVAAEGLRPGRDGRRNRLVVFGAASWCDDRPPHGYYDMDLFLNAANWIARRDTLTGIGHKDPTKTRFDMTEGERDLVFWLGIVFLPCGVGGLGWIVWLLRKRE